MGNGTNSPLYKSLHSPVSGAVPVSGAASAFPPVRPSPHPPPPPRSPAPPPPPPPPPPEPVPSSRSDPGVPSGLRPSVHLSPPGDAGALAAAADDEDDADDVAGDAGALPAADDDEDDADGLAVLAEEVVWAGCSPTLRPAPTATAAAATTVTGGAAGGDGGAAGCRCCCCRCSEEEEEETGGAVGGDLFLRLASQAGKSIVTFRRSVRASCTYCSVTCVHGNQLASKFDQENRTGRIGEEGVGEEAMERGGVGTRAQGGGQHAIRSCYQGDGGISKLKFDASRRAVGMLYPLRDHKEGMYAPGGRRDHGVSRRPLRVKPPLIVFQY